MRMSAGLELGADDYLTKPFARVSCWHASKPCCVASSEADAETTVVYDDVIIHPGRYECVRGRQLVPSLRQSSTFCTFWRDAQGHTFTL